MLGPLSEPDQNLKPDVSCGNVNTGQSCGLHVINLSYSKLTHSSSTDVSQAAPLGEMVTGQCSTPPSTHRHLYWCKHSPLSLAPVV